MVLFSVLGWHTTKRFQYWVDIPQYVLRKRSNNKTMPQTKFSGEIDNNVHVIISLSITQVFHILATLERSRQLGVQHNMELLVVLVCPSEGVTGPHVLSCAPASACRGTTCGPHQMHWKGQLCRLYISVWAPSSGSDPTARYTKTSAIGMFWSLVATAKRGPFQWCRETASRGQSVSTVGLTQYPLFPRPLLQWD